MDVRLNSKHFYFYKENETDPFSLNVYEIKINLPYFSSEQTELTLSPKCKKINNMSEANNYINVQ